MINALPDGVRAETGGYQPSILEGVDMVVVSPGVPLKQPFFDAVRAEGIELLGELELAYRVVSRYGIPWVAVTGSNGKSTTVTLLDLILRKQGFSIITGGNIGVPVTEEIMKAAVSDSIRDIDYILVEVSSFQLESIRDFRPSVASILNITPDHLDRYEDMEEYIQAKTAIFMNQREGDRLILNLDDPVTSGLQVPDGPEVSFFSKYEATGQASAFIKDDWVCIRDDEGERRVIKSEDIRIKGIHNIENSLAAALNAYICGVDLHLIRDVLHEFGGLEHRMEFVDEIDGVVFYNDSKGTNIGSVIKSLEGIEGGVVLILGGRDKGSDFSVLRDHIDGRVRRLLLIGEASEKIAGQLGDIAGTIPAGNMEEAVREAFRVSESGDTVLLSPGCASFDMFSSFEHRGNEFKRSVRELKSDRITGCRQ